MISRQTIVTTLIVVRSSYFKLFVQAIDVILTQTIAYKRN